MQVLLNTKDAAAYARLPLNFFRLQVRHGNGPDFVQPSPKRKFFAPEALDRWIASWKTKEVFAFSQSDKRPIKKPARLAKNGLVRD